MGISIRSSTTTIRALALIAAALVPLTAAPARAATTGLRPTAEQSGASSLAIGGVLSFTADDGIHGRELWRSDGSGPGTMMVDDIHPGPDGSGPSGLTGMGRAMYFSANDGTHGDELWKSDGTALGTVMVADIRPGPTGSDPADFLAVRHTLFFTADDGTHGAALWKSDGTARGTVMVKEIVPSIFWAQQPFFAFHGDLYFTAADGIHGSELWKSDGTAAGTGMVRDIYPGADGNQEIVGVAGAVFLCADDGVHGRELWKSDGTKTGTVLVKDIRPGRATSDGGRGGQSFAVMGKDLYLTASSDHVASDDWVDELWKSDGTTAGTMRVARLGSRYGANSDPFSLYPVGDVLYLANSVLLKSDGTKGGTTLVASIRAGDLTGSDGFLYFTASAPYARYRYELWKSDGTGAGTAPLHTFVVPPHTYGLLPTDLTDGHGQVFFVADDGTHGWELWQSDGTAAGTTLVKDINAGSAPSTPDQLVFVG
jgi:large repetitive protein